MHRVDAGNGVRGNGAILHSLVEAGIVQGVNQSEPVLLFRMIKIDLFFKGEFIAATSMSKEVMVRFKASKPFVTFAVMGIISRIVCWRVIIQEGLG